jgi:CBS domain-containing protein/RNA polymerase-binding transcription factor DksA
MDVPVKAWMSGDPVSIDPEASALEALDLMVERGIRHLPVVDPKRRVLGVLSIDDLRAALPLPVTARTALSPADREVIRDYRVGEIMTHSPRTLREGVSLEQAAEQMADGRLGCLPVVDDSGRLVGLLSETDVLRALATSLWADRLREQRGKQNDLERLMEELRAERERIAGQLDGYHTVERELSATQHDLPMDQPERSAGLREVRLTEALDELAARRLEAIDRALDHAAQGRLSVCDGCGGTIPLTRLQALPGTTRCVACARQAESEPESEAPFERVPGGRAETGHPELGAQVYTRFGEGQLLRVVPFGTCRRCGDVEGRHDSNDDTILCASDGCRQALTDICERAIVAIGEREVYVDPAELASPDPTPYD